MSSLCRLSRSLVLLACAATSASLALAQSYEWRPGFHRPGVDGSISALAEFDDGTGSAVYAGGNFQHAGTLPVHSIARWDGTSWSALGEGVLGNVAALCVHDDGSGSALYVGGEFMTAGGQPLRGIARWDGIAWSGVGTGLVGDVRALAVYDDGGGPALYVAGAFAISGVPGANNIAKWDGASWSSLSTGMTLAPASVSALAVFDEGGGPRLFAAGSFSNAGSASVSNIARWDGASWSAVGAGVTGGTEVRALCVCAVGGVPALFASGFFTSAGGMSASHIARWNGSSWSPLGAGLTATGMALCAVDVGGGAQELCVAGTFLSAGGNPALRFVARWDGASWSGLSSGVDNFALSIAALDDGSGTKIFVGGGFHIAGATSTDSIARFDGVDWLPLSTGHGVNTIVRALAKFDAGAGEELVAGGQFSSIGTAPVPAIARWNGSGWSALGGGIGGSVFALAASPNGVGGGPELYAGGTFSLAGGASASRVARWDGSAWSPLGTGLVSPTGSQANALCIGTLAGSSSPALFAGGLFATAGGSTASNIASWDGLSWTALGAGIPSGTVFALAMFDDGNGDALYVGGNFTTAGAIAASCIARWDGMAWSTLGSGISGAGARVNALFAFDDGSGPALYAGGNFTSAGGVAAQDVARWNGTTWSAMPGLTHSDEITSFAAFDDGPGPRLHAGGSFFTSGSLPNGVARWTGSTWEALGAGIHEATPPGVHALASARAGGAQRSSLFVGGNFRTAGAELARSIAEWTLLAPAGTPFCFGDGLDTSHTTACPCANHGASGRGCASSVNPAGALLSASGTANPDTIVLAASGMPFSATAIYLQADALDDAVFGDGVRCGGGVLLRMRARTSSGGASQFPDSTDTVTLSLRGGVTPGSGTTRFYSAYYRNAAAAFCPPATFNVTNGWRIVW